MMRYALDCRTRVSPNKAIFMYSEILQVDHLWRNQVETFVPKSTKPGVLKSTPMTGLVSLKHKQENLLKNQYKQTRVPAQKMNKGRKKISMLKQNGKQQKLMMSFSTAQNMQKCLQSESMTMQSISFFSEVAPCSPPGPAEADKTLPESGAGIRRGRPEDGLDATCTGCSTPEVSDFS